MPRTKKSQEAPPKKKSEEASKEQKNPRKAAEASPKKQGTVNRKKSEEAPAKKKEASPRKNVKRSKSSSSEDRSKKASPKKLIRVPIQRQEKITEAVDKLYPLTRVHDPVILDDFEATKLATSGFLTLYNDYKAQLYPDKKVRAAITNKVALSQDMFMYYLARALREIELRIEPRHVNRIVQAIDKVALLTTSGDFQVTDPADPELEEVVKDVWGAACYVKAIAGEIADWLMHTQIFKYDDLGKKFLSLQKMKEPAPNVAKKKQAEWKEDLGIYKTVLDALYREYSDKFDAIFSPYEQEEPKLSADQFFLKFAIIESVSPLGSGRNLDDRLKMLAGEDIIGYNRSAILIEKMLTQKQKEELLEAAYGQLYKKYGY